MTNTKASPLHPADFSFGQKNKALIRRTAELVTCEDLQAELSRMPEDPRRRLLQHFKMGAAKTLSRATLEHLRALLKGGGARHRELVGILFSGAQPTWDNSAGLDAADVIAHLTPGAPLSERQTCLPHLYRSHSLLRWSAAMAVDLQLSLAPLALGLLVAEADIVGSEDAELLRSAWSALRAQVPELPAVPATAEEIIARMAAWQDLDASSAGDEPMPAPLLEELLVDVRTAFAGAVPAAERLVGAFTNGTRPLNGDLAALTAARDGFVELLRSIEIAGLPGAAEEIGPGSEDLSLDTVETLLRAAANDREIQRLVRLTGPDRLQDVVAEIRESATDGTHRAELELLLELLVQGVDDEREERAYEELPRAWLKLIPRIREGDVRITEEATDTRGESEGAPVAMAPEPPPIPEPELATSQKQLVPEPRPKPQDGVPYVPSVPSTVSVPREREKPNPPERDSTPAGVPTAASFCAEAVRAENSALAAGRLGLAAWIRAAEARPEPEINVRRAAALASRITGFADRDAPEFTDLIRGLTARTLNDDPLGRLLAFTSVVRAGLVYPTPESTKVLEEIVPVFGHLPGLRGCAEAFLRASRAGAYVVPGSYTASSDPAPQVEDRAEAVRKANELLKNGQQRKIKYERATTVLRILLDPRGELGRYLAFVGADDEREQGPVQDFLVRLAAKGAVDRMIDEVVADLGPRNGKGKIEAGARTSLHKHVQDALDVVRQWSAALRSARIRHPRGDEDWLVRALHDLRESVLPYRSTAAAELLEFGREHEVETGPAAALLSEAVMLLDGARPSSGGLLPAQLLHGDLLLAPSIPVDQELMPARLPELAELVSVALAGLPDWEAAFHARAELRDHAGTRGVIACLSVSDPDLADALAQARNDLVKTARVQRDEEIDGLRDRAAQWLRDGTLSERETLGIDSELQELGGDREDFGVVAERLREMAADLDALRRASIDQALTDVSDQVANNPQNPQLAASAEKAVELIESGDIMTANEIMEQAARGNAPAEAGTKVAYFPRFFPAFPGSFADLVIRESGKASKHLETRRALLTKIAHAAQQGREPSDPELAAIFVNAGIELSRLRPERREEVRAGLAQWQTLSQGQKAAGSLKTSIDKVLRIVGLQGEQQQGPEQANRAWITLNGVRPIGDSPLPAFGSAMSPSGEALRLLLVWRSPGVQEIVDLVKNGAGNQTILVFYFGLLDVEQRTELARVSRSRPSPVVGVIDDALIAFLGGMAEPDWNITVSLMAPFTANNPYTPTGEVPTEMFVGRDVQLEEVINPHGSSFVYGGRQLGKSALLDKAKRDLSLREPNRVVILESIQELGRGKRAAMLWPQLAKQLARFQVIPDGMAEQEEICSAVREWSAEDLSRQLLVLLDEADNFLNEDAREGDFAHVTALRDLMRNTGGRVKVVFAGLHQTGRFQSLPNQPLTHLGEPIAIGPLLPQHAFNLLVRPLAALGFTFPDHLAARVIAEANNAPALVQLFAEELLNRLRRLPRATARLPYEITRADIEAVWCDEKIEKGIKDRFEWTLNLDKRYKVIAYVVALHNLDHGLDSSLASAQLRKECEDWWGAGFASSGADGFRSLLEECVSLGVLRVEGDRYRLRTPHILRLLNGEAGVFEALEVASGFGEPEAFDPNSYRAAIGDDEPSPLTAGQMSGLLRARHELRVIAGSSALHLERVIEAIGDGHPQDKSGNVAGSATFIDAVKAAARRREPGLVIYQPARGESVETVADRISDARAIVAAEGRRAPTVVAVLSAAWSPLWDAEIIQLGKFDRAGLRGWLSDRFPSVNDQSVTRVLEVTGGWPALVQLVAARLKQGGDVETALFECQEHLGRAAAEFTASTGVQDHPVLTAAWHVLIDNDPDNPDQLAELLDLYAEYEPALADLPGHGFAAAAVVIDALRTLGALQPAGDGNLTCNPILRTATLACRAS
ncbi:hypothetical protein GCM10022221_20160 [Actinocorallia aurea]